MLFLFFINYVIDDLKQNKHKVLDIYDTIQNITHIKLIST